MLLREREMVEDGISVTDWCDGKWFSVGTPHEALLLFSLSCFQTPHTPTIVPLLFNPLFTITQSPAAKEELFSYPCGLLHAVLLD
jgi:hypothetical protein